MTLVALCSVKGSPGVTTASLALAALWPSGQQPVVVECDPAGGDLLGRFRLGAAPGLVSLAAAARRPALPAMIWEHTQRLPGGLPVVVGPAGEEQARATVGQITSSETSVLRRAADWAGTVVVADCGRADVDSPALAIAREADVLLLLARARDDALAHVAARLDVIASWSRHLCFVLVGEGYPTREIAQALGIEVFGRVPYDPKGAALLGGRASGRTALIRSPLGQSMARLTTATAASVHRWSAWGPDAPGPPPAFGASSAAVEWSYASAASYGARR